MHHINYPHRSPFQSLAQATRSPRTTYQTPATTISSRVSYPRASSIIPLVQIARAESQHVTRATSASASSSKKRTFGDFARGEEVEVAREDVEVVDAYVLFRNSCFFDAPKMSNLPRPPIGQIHTEQPIALSDALPVAYQNRTLRPIAFKSASANPRPSLYGKANAKPAAKLAAPVLGPQLARRHWSVEPTEEWVVQPKEATTPGAWPQKVLYSGVYFVGTVAAFSGIKLQAIAVGGWRGARSFYQNRRQIRQECAMAVVTGYSSAKRRLVTLRRRAIPAQLLWRRQFDPAVERNGRPQDRRFLWQRNPGQEDAMEDVRSTYEVFVTPPTTRYSTPEEYVNEVRPSTPADSRPRTYWASDRGFQMGEKRGPRRPSEDSDASELEEYLWDESVLPNIERAEELLASPTRPHMPLLHYSPSSAIREDPGSPEWRSSPGFEEEAILPSIETDEVTTILPDPTTNEDDILPPASPTPNFPAGGSPRLSTTSTDIGIIEEARPRAEQDSRSPSESRPLQPSPPAQATEEANETARAIPRRDLANGISEAEAATYLEWVANLGRQMANQKEGETPKYHAFGPAFYASLKKKGAKSVKTWASEAHIGGSTLLDVEQLFIPVFQADKHWSLLVVSPKAKTINYYDSLGSSARPHIRLVKTWLAQELGKAYRERDWSTPSGSRGAGPRQAHRADCGIIACMTARMLVLGRDPMALDCSAEAIGDQWTRMKAELSGGGGGLP